MLKSYVMMFKPQKKKSCLHCVFIVFSALFFVGASAIQFAASVDPTIHTNHPCLDPW